MASAFWNKLDDKIHRPADLKNIEYRESHVSVFADDKLYFFGLRGVSPTSMNFHETTLLGGFVSIFDIKTKQWSFKSIEKIDDDENHREHLFVVLDKIFMYVYSTAEIYQKLFIWKNDKWIEVKMDAAHCSAFKLPSSLYIYDTEDGFYVLYEAGLGNVAKMDVSVENGDFKNAVQTHLADVSMLDLKGMGVHLVALAFDKDKLFVWYGQQGCGFRWEPTKPLFADLHSKPIHFVPKELAGPRPPYAFGGPRNTIMLKNKWIMLGGSVQAGMSHTKDCNEIWVFDVDSQKFSRTNADTPHDVPGWRLSTAFDRSSGSAYLCDLEKGIFVANLRNLHLVETLTQPLFAPVCE